MANSNPPIVPQTPVWGGASTGSPMFAGQVNQFLGGHASSILYQATQQAASSAAQSTSTAVTTANQYLGMPFTTGSTQTTLGYVYLYMICSNPGSPTYSNPITLSVYADSGSSSPVLFATNAAGAQVSVTPITSTTLTREYVFQAPYPLIIPLPTTSLVASTKYWLVTSIGPNDGVNYRISKATDTSGGAAYISTNGTTWTAQSYGLAYATFDQVPLSTAGLGSNLIGTWEDNGARWTVMYRKTVGPGNVNNFITAAYGYTAGQAGAQSYVQSYRNNVNTSSGQLTIVT